MQTSTTCNIPSGGAYTKQILIFCLFGDEHALLESLPGLAKSLPISSSSLPSAASRRNGFRCTPKLRRAKSPAPGCSTKKPGALTSAQAPITKLGTAVHQLKLNSRKVHTLVTSFHSRGFSAARAAPCQLDRVRYPFWKRKETNSLARIRTSTPAEPACRGRLHGGEAGRKLRHDQREARRLRRSLDECGRG